MLTQDESTERAYPWRPTPSNTLPDCEPPDPPPIPTPSRARRLALQIAERSSTELPMRPELLAERCGVDPRRVHEVFAHTILLPMLGLPLGELFFLDDLAADCAADGRYEFLFTSAPLNLPHGVASPPNALAIK